MTRRTWWAAAVVLLLLGSVGCVTAPEEELTSAADPVGPTTAAAASPVTSASDEGLGEWAFGDPAASVLSGMTERFGEPDHDPGWDRFVRIPGSGDGWYAVEGDPLSPRWDHPFFRSVCWQSLCAIFGGASETDSVFLGWELSRWQAWNGYADVDVSEPHIALQGTGIRLGDTWADVRAAYPDAVPGGGEGSSLVIDNPPWPGIFDGVGGWRLDGTWDPERPTYAPDGAAITRMSGGTGPEPGCC